MSLVCFYVMISFCNFAKNILQMEIIQVKDKSFSVFLTEEQIKSRVKEVGEQISKDLKDKNPIFLAVLNGSFVFVADLLRSVDIPCEITFIRLSSYEGMSSTGSVKHLMGLKENIEGRTVVIVEDIVDSGYTMRELLAVLKEKNPGEVRIASLLVKPGNLKVDLDIPYRCFDIPNDFIVGYGLDYDGYGRNLKQIYKVVE